MGVWGDSSFPSIPSHASSQESRLPRLERIGAVSSASRPRSRSPTAPGLRSGMQRPCTASERVAEETLKSSPCSIRQVVRSGVGLRAPGGEACLIHSEGHHRSRYPLCRRGQTRGFTKSLFSCYFVPNRLLCDVGDRVVTIAVLGSALRGLPTLQQRVRVLEGIQFQVHRKV